MPTTSTLGHVKQFVLDHIPTFGLRQKLSPKEANLVCEQIGFFMRHHCTLAVALRKVADSTRTLLGRRVGVRALREAWDNRDPNFEETARRRVLEEA